MRWVRPVILASLVSCTWLIGGCTKQEKPPALLQDSNVVLVLVDTLRADYLGVFGHRLPTSPTLDRVANESVVFERVIAPASQTVPSMLSLWSGMYPNRHGNQYYAGIRAFRVPTPRTKPRVPDHIPFISERFRERGYKTGAIVTNPWLRDDFGFGRGFDHYDHMTSIPPFPRGEKVNQAAFELLRKWKEDRFLLWLHYMDAHAPYSEEPRYGSVFPDDLSEHKGTATLLAGYNAEIRAVDDYFRDLLRMLSDLGLEQNTLVVFTSDHGEEFGEHGGFGHGHALFQEVVHVPLLLYHPKLKPLARRIDAPVSLVDIAPTVLELTTGETEVAGDGISLASYVRDGGSPPVERVVFTELGEITAALRGEKKVIRSRRKKNPGELAYDLAADPGEKVVVEGDREWIRELRTALDEHENRQVVDGEEVDPIDPATEERVRALGY